MKRAALAAMTLALAACGSGGSSCDDASTAVGACVGALGGSNAAAVSSALSQVCAQGTACSGTADGSLQNAINCIAHVPCSSDLSVYEGAVNLCLSSNGCVTVPFDSL